ncbi:hypothetical protein WICMUC_004921 [Wickerhamomyces mucosus]|uniref:Cell wall synthesis protein KRE9 n=1 Tax=Wickerhamomyces mucosus TaxID=1378264 RepID=A0A9P8PDI8_9ASCO|nr:hypothetical protein WICMUC_004921 [Wickerhamomyces mucosus]
MFGTLSFLLVFLISTVFCDVSVSKPSSGQTYTVSGSTVTVPISWLESNSNPLLTEITSYKFEVCTGPNSLIDGIRETLVEVSSSDITDYSYDFEIESSVGADGLYYIQINAFTSEGHTIHYSNRFTLSGMTGSKQPSGSGTPPASQINLITGTSTLDAAQLSSSFALAYTLQTGITRYAPMQTQPGSTVTATTWTKRFPASSVTYYSTMRSSLDQSSTLTPGWSYTISSAVNWASYASDPTDNGGWYNPKTKIRSPSLRSLSSATSSGSSTSSSSA